MGKKSVRPTSPSEYSESYNFSVDSSDTLYPRNRLIEDETSSPVPSTPPSSPPVVVAQLTGAQIRAADPRLSGSRSDHPELRPVRNKPISRQLQPIDDKLSKYIFAVGNGKARKIVKKKFKKRKFDCKTCNKTFTNQNQLLFHRQSKSHQKGIQALRARNKAIKCHPCGKLFQCQNDLTIHLASSKHHRTIRFLQNHAH